MAEARCHGWEGIEPNRVYHDCGLVILVPELCGYLYHVNGHAVDIALLNMADMDELEAIARRYFPFVLRYSWELHCDIRGERPC